MERQNIEKSTNDYKFKIGSFYTMTLKINKQKIDGENFYSVTFGGFSTDFHSYFAIIDIINSLVIPYELRSIIIKKIEELEHGRNHQADRKKST